MFKPKTFQEDIFDMKDSIPAHQEFATNSYQRHANWYNDLYPERIQKMQILFSIKDNQGSINHWLQQLFFKCLDPFMQEKQASWFTVGDAYGHDAQYLLEKGVEDVTASDLNGDFLALSQEIGLIEKYAVENAEAMSLGDNSVDYILCKETYHHFPRPYAALYEMIRVAREAIVIIEPQDPILKMPLLLFMNNLLARVNDKLIAKVWKNRFSYERVGNFVYKTSEREFEKLAAGLNLPMIAVKALNPNFWFLGSNNIPAKRTSHKFRKVLWKKGLRDLLSKVGAVPSQTLSIVVFKQLPSPAVRQSLIADGYRLVEIPQNPYL